jgi:hypothetical protein
MIQAPIPPGFVPPPLDWFQFAMLYLAFLELIVIALPQRWQNQILRVLFCAKRSFPERGRKCFCVAGAFALSYLYWIRN